MPLCVHSAIGLCVGGRPLRHRDGGVGGGAGTRHCHQRLRRRVAGILRASLGALCTRTEVLLKRGLSPCAEEPAESERVGCRASGAVCGSALLTALLVGVLWMFLISSASAAACRMRRRAAALKVTPSAPRLAASGACAESRAPHVASIIDVMVRPEHHFPCGFLHSGPREGVGRHAGTLWDRYL